MTPAYKRKRRQKKCMHVTSYLDNPTLEAIRNIKKPKKKNHYYLYGSFEAHTNDN